MNKYENIIRKLKKKGVIFDYGISSQEMDTIEAFYGISFPVELKIFYSLGVPVSKGFYNWRDLNPGNSRYIKGILEMPLEGLQFDVIENDVWCEKWGTRPNNDEEALNLLLSHYSNAPKLIPIYSHRYMPFIPESKHTPVFSIMQSDIIYYGTDLISYLEVEFGEKDYSNYQLDDFQYINFWSDLL